MTRTAVKETDIKILNKGRLDRLEAYFIANERFIQTKTSNSIDLMLPNRRSPDNSYVVLKILITAVLSFATCLTFCYYLISTILRS